MAFEYGAENDGVFLGVVFEVGILEDGEVAGGFCDGASNGGAFALIGVLGNDLDVVGEFLLQACQDFWRAVGGAIVDDNEFFLEREIDGEYAAY